MYQRVFIQRVTHTKTDHSRYGSRRGTDTSDINGKQPPVLSSSKKLLERAEASYYILTSGVVVETVHTAMVVR
jgi:hypothetical protein